MKTILRYLTITDAYFYAMMFGLGGKTYRQISAPEDRPYGFT